MKPHHTLFTLALLLCSFLSQAQTQRDINLRVSQDNTNIRSIDLFAGNIIISVSQKGKVHLNALNGTQYGYIDAFGSQHDDNNFRTLDNRQIEYYDNFDESRAGKIKSIGNITVTYYDKFDGFENIGRVKNIGTFHFTYYDKFDGFDNIGKLKSVGGINITYYDRFDGSDSNGKLKNIGNTHIAYYDRFDASNLFGQIKSVTGRTSHVTINNSPAGLMTANDGF